MSGVLFVCTGNMCRSPLAAAKFRTLMVEYGLTGWEISSAGTWIENGLKSDKRTRSWAKKRGLDLKEHTTQRVTGRMLSEYDLIVVMDTGHKEALHTNYPGLNGNVIGLSELSGPFYDIPDPISLTDEEFDAVAQEVVSLVEKGFSEIALRLTKKQFQKAVPE